MAGLVSHIAKEFAEMLRRPALRASAGSVSPRAASLAAKIRRSGFATLPDHWSEQQCDVAKLAIDSLCSRPGLEGEWVDAEGSDHRFFRAEKHSAAFDAFLHDPLIEEVRRAYTGRRSAEKFVLAARMRHKTGNKGSGGGWHLDSPHSLQFKAILYLTDCGLDSGPFQLIPGSHDRVFQLRMLMSGLRRPNQYRFTDSEVEPIIARGFSTKTFSAARGTIVLADVTALHRGVPIKVGERYALTLYCGDPKFDGSQ